MDYSSGGMYRSARQQPSRLSGTGLAGDDLWLIGHNEATGRPHLPPRPLGIGLAGALLAELMTTDIPAVITVRHGHVLPDHRRDRGLAARPAHPGDPVTGPVLDLIMSEPAPRPVRDWLLFLGTTSATAVAGRLGRSGYLAEQPSRRPWRAAQPVPRDGNWSHCALLRAHAAIDAARELTPYSALLAGLMLACGLGFRLSGLSGSPGRAAGQAMQALPYPLQELIAQVQATADSTVLAARR